MAISCALWQVARETIDDIEKDPQIIEEVIAALHEYNNDLPDKAKVYLDIDKSWDGLSYLLKRSKKPSLASLFKSDGLHVSAFDLGYGPARCIYPEAVLEFKNSSLELTFEKLSAGTTLADLIAAKVYPFKESEKDQEVFLYLAEHWRALNSFLESTVINQRGLLIYLF